jgi:nucleotide-binding universal stress UspA family protein
MTEILREEAMTRAHDAVLTAEKTIRQAGLECGGMVLTGPAREAIIDEAKEWAADLVVVGSHGLGVIARLLIGSVAEAVSVHAHCSVEVIRERVTSEQ